MLEEIVVDEAVRALRPDFAVLLLTAEGLVNGASDGGFGNEPRAVETRHVEAWREAYRGFGVNPGGPARPWTPCCAAPNCQRSTGSWTPTTR